MPVKDGTHERILARVVVVPRIYLSLSRPRFPVRPTAHTLSDKPFLTAARASRLVT